MYPQLSPHLSTYTTDEVSAKSFASLAGVAGILAATLTIRLEKMEE